MTDVGTEQKVYPWGDGMPTGPDVAMLQKQYRDLQPGDRIEYEDVEILLGVDRRSARWASVTNAWRRREFENGIVIDCDPGEAFIVLTADQISAKTYGAIKHVGHTVRKQRKQLATIRPENDDRRKALVHQMTLLSHLERESKKARMNIIPSLPAAQTPQIAPPKASGLTPAQQATRGDR